MCDRVIEKLKNTQKQKSNKKIIIQELMFKQMKENLGSNIKEYVESTKINLQQIGPIKARKIVSSVQRNLNQFIKGTYNNKIRLTTEQYSSFKNYDKSDHSFQPASIFNPILLNKQLKKIQTKRQWRQDQGILRRNALTACRKFRKPTDIKNIVLNDRKNQCYSSRSNRNRNKIFNIIMNK